MDSPTLVWFVIFFMFHTPLCTWSYFWNVFCFTGLSTPTPIQNMLISGYFMNFLNYGFVLLSYCEVTYKKSINVCTFFNRTTFWTLLFIVFYRIELILLTEHFSTLVSQLLGFVTQKKGEGRFCCQRRWEICDWIKPFIYYCALLIHEKRVWQKAFP